MEWLYSAFPTRPKLLTTVLDQRIGADICYDSWWNHALSSERTNITNSCYHLLRDAHGLSESTGCRVVHSVVAAVNKSLVWWIGLLAKRLSRICECFLWNAWHAICRWINRWNSNIKTLSENEEQFVDHRGKHSLNMLLSCAPNINCLL